MELLTSLLALGQPRVGSVRHLLPSVPRALGLTFLPLCSWPDAILLQCGEAACCRLASEEQSEAGLMFSFTGVTFGIKYGVTERGEEAGVKQ